MELTERKASQLLEDVGTKARFRKLDREGPETTAMSGGARAAAFAKLS